MSFKNGEKEDNCHLSDRSTMKLTANHIKNKQTKQTQKNNRQVQTKEAQQAETELTCSKTKKQKTFSSLTKTMFPFWVRSEHEVHTR